MNLIINLLMFQILKKKFKQNLKCNVINFNKNFLKTKFK